MLQVVKGKVPAPLKVVMYGPEGIGKSSFASLWPEPLFIDLEHGTGQLEVDRLSPDSFAEVEEIMGGLLRQEHAYRTLVFDTADWLDRIIIRDLCAGAGKKGIEDFGYGKGFTYLAEQWASFLDRLSRFQRRRPMHIVFLAHAAMRKFEQPEEQGAFDRWELKCSKTVSPLLKEWADMLLFANYKIIVVEADGRKKASGGRRVIYTNHHVCYDAKNRFGLSPELPFEPGRLPPGLDAVIRANTPVLSGLGENPVEPPPASAPPAVSGPAETAPAETENRTALLGQLGTLLEMGGISEAELMAEVARNGVAPAGTPLVNLNEATLGRLIAGWEVIKSNITNNRQR